MSHIIKGRILTLHIKTVANGFGVLIVASVLLTKQISTLPDLWTISQKIQRISQKIRRISENNFVSISPLFGGAINHVVFTKFEVFTSKRSYKIERYSRLVCHNFKKLNNYTVIKITWFVEDIICIESLQVGGCDAWKLSYHLWQLIRKLYEIQGSKDNEPSGCIDSQILMIQLEWLTTDLNLPKGHENSDQPGQPPTISISMYLIRYSLKSF